LLVVRDLATTNGTKVKGQRVRWAALLPDDRLTLGAYKLRVYLGPDSVPGPSERPAAAAKRVVRPGAAGQAVPLVAPLDVAPSPATPFSPLAPGAEFATPSPLSVPAAGADLNLADLEIVDEASDSGWRQLIASRHRENDEGQDLLIELD
jgi:hypothetical protein